MGSRGEFYRLSFPVPATLSSLYIATHFLRQGRNFSRRGARMKRLAALQKRSRGIKGRGFSRELKPSTDRGILYSDGDGG